MKYKINKNYKAKPYSNLNLISTIAILSSYNKIYSSKLNLHVTFYMDILWPSTNTSLYLHRCHLNDLSSVDMEIRNKSIYVT